MYYSVLNGIVTVCGESVSRRHCFQLFGVIVFKTAFGGVFYAG